ncbi:hypothetical protein BESB_037230 [Besnoitia besnoiti]|uniref:Transmembrane protein n=1 Tax=Besnoitia besnoiti TaxID=94643 RepID=A0A2A9MH21_BESBE|nr:hypothetical protein BESB_037230 [Besnoitia besnoiti]PFH37265.1 hypothetical protein BESB_037230 [Besnoitia besnoiti]
MAAPRLRALFVLLALVALSSLCLSKEAFNSAPLAASPVVGASAEAAPASGSANAASEDDDDEDEFIYQDAPEPATAPATAASTAAVSSQPAGAAKDSPPLAFGSSPRASVPPPPKSYLPEILFAVTVAVVIAVAVWGRKKNIHVADAWIGSVSSLLKANFAVVGYENSYLVMKSYNVFELYCTGRRNCFCLHGVLQCLPRQCLWRHFFVGPLFRSQAEDSANSVTLELLLTPSAEPGVVAVCKRTEQKQLMSSNWDLREFAKARTAASNPKLAQLGSNLVAFSDTSDALDSLVLGNKTATKTLAACAEFFRFLYFSDVCSSIHPSLVPTAATCPGASANTRTFRVLRMSFFLPPNDRMEEVEPLLRLALFLADQARHLGLSDKSVEVAKKMRLQYQKEMLKEQEEQRQEQLEKKRSERKRLDEEKYQNMTPEQQRKYEEKEYKKSLKQKKGRFKVRSLPTLAVLKI